MSPARDDQRQNPPERKQDENRHRIERGLSPKANAPAPLLMINLPLITTLPQNPFLPGSGTLPTRPTSSSSLSLPPKPCSTTLPDTPRANYSNQINVNRAFAPMSKLGSSSSSSTGDDRGRTSATHQSIPKRPRQSSRSRSPPRARGTAMEALHPSHADAQSPIDHQSLKRGVSAMSSEPAQPSSPKMPRFTTSSALRDRDRDNRSVSPPSRDSPLPHRLPPTHPPSYNRFPSSRDSTPALSRDSTETRSTLRSSHSRASSGEMNLSSPLDPRRLPNPRTVSASFADAGGPSRPQQSKARPNLQADSSVAALVNGVLGRLKSSGVVPLDVPGMGSSEAMDISCDEMDVEPAAVIAPPSRPAVLKAEPMDTPSPVLPSAPVAELPQVQKDVVRPDIAREATLAVDPTPTPQTVVFPSSPTVSAASCPSASLSRRLLPEERSLPREFSKDLLPALVKAFTATVESRLEWDACKKDINRLKFNPLLVGDSECPADDKAKAVPPTEPQRPVDPRKRKAMEAAAAAEARVAEREARRKVETRLKEAETRYQEKMSELDWAFMSVHKVMRVDLESLASALQTSFEASRARSQSPTPALGLQIEAPSLVVDGNVAAYVNEDRLHEMESCFLGKLNELRDTSCQAFSTLDGHRMELADTFDDKFERLASVFVKPTDLADHKKAVVSLEERVQSLANQVGVAISKTSEVDKVWTRLTGLEKSVTEVNESEKRYAAVSARVAAMEKEWKAFDAFDKGSGAVIDVNDARHSLRTKLKNMDSNLTLKTEFLETAVDKRIIELESTYNAKIDTMSKTREKKQAAFETTLDERFSSIEASVDTKLKTSETRAEQLVNGVEATLSSRVDSAESAMLGKLEALQASMNQKFLDIQAAHTLQLDAVKGQLVTLVGVNQCLRKALEEERQGRLAAQAGAEKIAQELKAKIASIEQDTPKIREELGKIGESLEVCTVDVLDLQSKYQRVSSDADNYHFLRSSINRTLAEAEGRSRRPGSVGASTGTGSSRSPQSNTNSPQRANQAVPSTQHPKAESQTGL
ncbi:hypothetical protein FS837_011313 [Tulasnella sp. UAMH 9824]|nr:hypothetical protein FS837_011313 [Tulasnella sp. UAMH 9824]